MPVNFNILNRYIFKAQANIESENESILGMGMREIHSSNERIQSMMEEGIDAAASGIASAARAVDSFTGKIIHIVAHHPVKFAVSLAGVFLAGTAFGMGLGTVTATNSVDNEGSYDTLLGNATKSTSSTASSGITDNQPPTAQTSAMFTNATTTALTSTAIPSTAMPVELTTSAKPTPSPVITTTLPKPEFEPCKLQDGYFSQKYLDLFNKHSNPTGTATHNALLGLPSDITTVEYNQVLCVASELASAADLQELTSAFEKITDRGIMQLGAVQSCFSAFEHLFNNNNLVSNITKEQWGEIAATQETGLSGAFYRVIENFIASLLDVADSDSIEKEVEKTLVLFENALQVMAKKITILNKPEVFHNHRLNSHKLRQAYATVVDFCSDGSSSIATSHPKLFALLNAKQEMIYKNILAFSQAVGYDALTKHLQTQYQGLWNKVNG